jgi:DNA-binding NarL/FixJ family response regulator
MAFRSGTDRPPLFCDRLHHLALAALSEGNNPLTSREREVLTASLFGASMAEIAARLSLSEGTVRNHLSAAIQKLHGSLSKRGGYDKE